MTQMVPDVPIHELSNRGERYIYGLLRGGSGSDDWIVLHSLELARHQTQRQGEIDFLVLVPGKGILVLEVKGSSRVERRFGRWLFDGERRKNPFKQASEAMHSLKKRVEERAPSLKGLTWGSAVAFTQADFSEQSGEWHPWEVIPAPRIAHEPLTKLIDESLQFWRSYQPGTQAPSRDQAREMRDLLRADFTARRSDASQRRQLQWEVEQHTDQQIRALSSILSVRRTLVLGPPGTGKTLLALSAASRAADSGKSVLFLCFNRLLAEDITERLRLVAPQVIVATIEQYMLMVTGQTSPGPQGTLLRSPGAGADDDHRRWLEQDLPLAAAEVLLDMDESERYDVLIVDELQDLAVELFLDVLDLSVKGGLDRGNWHLFGDPFGQRVYDSPQLARILSLPERLPQTVTLSLDINCRNTSAVAQYASDLGDFRPQYSHVLRGEQGHRVEVIPYRSGNEQLVLLESVLNEAHHSGALMGDGVVLSMKFAGSAAERLPEGGWADRIRPLGSQADVSIRYGNIRSFKGLEAAHVVVTDIDEWNEETVTLVAIAASRSLGDVVVLARETVASRLRSGQ